MAIGALTESQAADILECELGGGWQISESLGTMQSTRLARAGARSVAVKLLQTPAVIMNQLSQLGVTPAVIALGESQGRPYMVQEAVEGTHPDHAWFLANRVSWSAMIRRYLDDPELADLLAGRPGFWRLDVSAAVAMINRDRERAPGHSPALQSPDPGAAVERWRQQAESIRSWPMRPIHPDAHWHNYVIAEGSPLLLDWDYIDLSDPIRDVGSQVWGFLPSRHWPGFLRRLGLPDEDCEQAICWWAAFKLLSNALFNDSRDDPAGAEFHIGAFLVAVDRRPWLGTGR